MRLNLVRVECFHARQLFWRKRSNPPLAEVAVLGSSCASGSTTRQIGRARNFFGRLAAAAHHASAEDLTILRKSLR